ncbi:hypothetical protein [Ascidiaceihabitans sp.]|uniref:hypothetical protein n=1 Tax=Ascidiaceihabitans sp. TaxID=1872644 RepID=UPI003297EFB5
MMMSDKRTGRVVALLASVMMLTPDLGRAGTKTAKPMQPSTVFNAEKRKKTKHDIGQHLSYSMYSSFRYQSENNRRRDDGIDDHTEEYALYLGFVGRADLGRGVIAFGHAELDTRSKSTQDRRYDLATQWKTKEAFVSFKVAAQAHVIVGRMRFSDPHKWVADLAVDGVHYGHKGKQQVTEFAVFRGTGDVTASYLMAHHGRVMDQNRYGILALLENDSPDTRAHLAGYANVFVSKKVSYELNLGAVIGDAANGKNAGFGIDVRSIRKFGTSDLNPQMMFGFAAGTEGYR